MRSRTVALAVLGLALSAIAAAPAPASTQTAITQDVSAGGHASFPLDSLSYLDVTVREAAIVRVIRADSAGHRLLVVMVKPLPNPAPRQARTAASAYRSSSRLAFNDSRSISEYAERSSLTPFPMSLAPADRYYNQRFTSALRGAALIGTLVKGRSTRL